MRWSGSVGPALTGRLAPTDDFDQVPDYWQQAVDELGDPGDRSDGVALLVPGSSFATYLWGTPEDEPLQALGRSRWAVRNAVPLAPPGNIRMLDAIEERLAAGRPSAGLAGFLARAGVDRLVVRNDLRGAEPVEPVLVHQALDGSPGLRRVASYGPEVGGPVRLDRGSDGPRVVLDSGWEEPLPAVEVYRVEPLATGASGVRAGRPSLVVGGPEDLLTLIDEGLLGDQPAVLATDVGPEAETPSDLLLTDGLRRQERNFARIGDGRSATLEAGDPGRRGAPARDYLLGDDGETERWETVAETRGRPASLHPRPRRTPTPPARCGPRRCPSRRSTDSSTAPGAPGSSRPAARPGSRWTSTTCSGSPPSPSSSVRPAAPVGRAGRRTTTPRASGCGPTPV